MDLYRVEEEELLEELGIRELLGGKAVVLVEWWTKFPNFFPSPHLRIHLKVLPIGRREITIEKVDT